MPKTKKVVESDDGASSSDSGPEDRYEAPKKKQKTEGSSSGGKGGSSGLKKNANGEYTFDLAKMRSVTVSDFKGRVFVNIREYYLDKDTGDSRPGKKGIALSIEQWNKLKEHMDGIDEAVKQIS